MVIVLLSTVVMSFLGRSWRILIRSCSIPSPSQDGRFSKGEVTSLRKIYHLTPGAPLLCVKILKKGFHVMNWLGFYLVPSNYHKDKPKSMWLSLSKDYNIEPVNHIIYSWLSLSKVLVIILIKRLQYLNSKSYYWLVINWTCFYAGGI